MKRFFWILLLPSFLFPQSAEELARKAEDWLRSYRTLEVDFRQLSVSATVSTPLEEKGRLFIQNPNRMKWEYREPEKKTYILKDMLYQEYLPEEKLLQEQILSQDEEGMEIISLLSGKSKILEKYDVAISAYPEENDGIHNISLTPRGENSDITIILGIDAVDWRIHKAIFIDWDGNRQELHFSRYRINPGFAADFFDLKVPSDVEIIR